MSFRCRVAGGNEVVCCHRTERVDEVPSRLGHSGREPDADVGRDQMDESETEGRPTTTKDDLTKHDVNSSCRYKI